MIDLRLKALGQVKLLFNKNKARLNRAEHGNGRPDKKKTVRKNYTDTQSG